MFMAGFLCAALVAAQPAAGEKPEGVYLTLSGMALLQQDSDLQTLAGTPLDATLEFDPGFGVQGGVGHTWSWSGVSLSLELDYAYRTAETSEVSGPSTLGASGTNESHTAMLGAIVAVDVSGGFGVYAGGGVGATLTRTELLLDVGGGTTLAFPADEDVTLAWQVAGGVQYAFNERFLVYGGVTYFSAGDSEFAAFVSENSSLAVVLGLRVYF